ncbi:uncharacterized protein V1510DRAFT_248627 [Dipodascopsis tothii]|uniref:uncharacterized protein n=1 Tax=Dipodascopsis tothii TaxID=44089 RepID=UPI0034CFAFD1
MLALAGQAGGSMTTASRRIGSPARTRIASGFLADSSWPLASPPSAVVTRRHIGHRVCRDDVAATLRLPLRERPGRQTAPQSGRVWQRRGPIADSRADAVGKQRGDRGEQGCRKRVWGCGAAAARRTGVVCCRAAAAAAGVCSALPVIAAVVATTRSRGPRRRRCRGCVAAVAAAAYARSRKRAALTRSLHGVAAKPPLPASPPTAGHGLVGLCGQQPANDNWVSGLDLCGLVLLVHVVFYVPYFKS